MQLGGCKVEVFRGIETPIRVLLRATDSHEPSLCLVKSLFDEARRKSLEAAALADQQMPLIYGHLSAAVRANFDKREADIVTQTCLAACMVYPGHVFTANSNILPFNPDGGQDAIIWAIQKYYPTSSDVTKDESVKQAACLVNYNEFRNKSGIESAKTSITAVIFFSDFDSPESFSTVCIAFIHASDVSNMFSNGVADSSFVSMTATISFVPTCIN